MSDNLLITSGRVADFLKVPDSPAFEPHILHAQAIVAGEIGTESLIARPVVQTEMLRAPIVILRDGPLSALTSVTVGGTAVDIGWLIIGKWTLRYNDWYRSLTFAGSTAVSFIAGYTPKTVPPRIAEALVQLAVIRYKNPDSDMVSEKIGDYSYQRKGAMQAGKDAPTIPKEIARMLDAYRRPGVA